MDFGQTSRETYMGVFVLDRLVMVNAVNAPLHRER